MLRAGLIDEVSLLVAPIADGRMGTAALFAVDGDDVTPQRLVLESVERRAEDVLWIRYRVRAASSDGLAGDRGAGVLALSRARDEAS